MKVRLNKKIIIPIIVLVLLCGVAAFVTCKTTLVAGMIACSSENVALQDYMQIQIMPKEHNFSSYKDMLVYQIRVDKAAKQRAQEEALRTEVAYEPVRKLAQMITGAYTYIDSMATEQENAEKYRSYMDGLQAETVTEAEKSAITELIASIADTAHFAMSTDVYYKGYTREQMKTLAEGFQVGLQACTVTEEFIIEQITPGEYDPEPEFGIAKQYAMDIAKISEVAGSADYSYDYIVQFSQHHNSTGSPLLKATVTAIVSEKNFVVLEAGAVLYDENVFQIAAHGSVRPYGTTEVAVVAPEEPVVLQLAKMQEKADEFVGVVYDIFKVYFANEEAFEELYDAYYVVEDVEEIEGAVTEAGAEDAEGMEVTEVAEATDAESTKGVDYESLQIAQMEKNLQADIETKYSVDTEWASMIFLSNLFNMMAEGNSILLTERFLNENKDDWAAKGVTQKQVDEFAQQAEKIKSLQANLSDPVLAQERIILPESVWEEDLGSEIANKSLADLQQSFTAGYEAWCEGTVPESLYGGYYQYEFPGIATVELAVVYTEQDIYITEMAMKWMDTESLFTDLSASYTIPNTVRMYKEAESNVNRELYSTEEAYQRAINQWLYANYPQYYSNPSQQAGVTTSSNYSYGGSYGNSKILQGIRKAANTVEDVWDGVGYALEGTLAGYLFTDNGSFRSFDDDVTQAVEVLKEEANALANEVKKEVNTMVNGVKNWWHGLWH